jgi:hypothetical protein
MGIGCANKEVSDFKSIYCHILCAPVTDTEWRLTVVGFLTITKFVMTAMLFCVLVFLSMCLSMMIFQKNISELAFVVSLVAGLIAWGYAETCLSSRCVRAANTLYVVATHMVRTKSLKKGIHLICFVFKSLALFFALISWYTHVYRDQKFTGKELETLGIIFSREKFWKEAHQVYCEIGNLYAARFQGVVDLKEVSVAFAFACKWMMNDTRKKTIRKSLLVASIRQVIVDNSEKIEPDILLCLGKSVGCLDPFRFNPIEAINVS